MRRVSYRYGTPVTPVDVWVTRGPFPTLAPHDASFLGAYQLKYHCKLAARTNLMRLFPCRGGEEGPVRRASFRYGTPVTPVDACVIC